MGIVFPLPPATVVRVDGNFHELPWSWRLFVLLEIICAWHTPLNFHIWISEGQGQSAELRRGLGQSNWLVWRLRPYTIYGRACAFEGQGWLSDQPCLITFTFHFDLELGGVTPNLCWMVWPYIFLQNLFQKWMEKHLKSSWKTPSSMGTGKEIYILLRFTITH